MEWLEEGEEKFPKLLILKKYILILPKNTSSASANLMLIIKPAMIGEAQKENLSNSIQNREIFLVCFVELVVVVGRITIS